MSRVRKVNKENYKLLFVASNIVELECMINDYFYSKYYRVTDDLMIHNDAMRIDLLGDYIEWYTDFNLKFRIFRTKNGYKFYRYYGL